MANMATRARPYGRSHEWRTLQRGQITVNFGSKENLFNEIIMDIHAETCRHYDLLIGEYIKRNSLLTEADAWRLIETIVDK